MDHDPERPKDTGSQPTMPTTRLNRAAITEVREQCVMVVARLEYLEEAVRTKTIKPEKLHSLLSDALKTAQVARDQARALDEAAAQANTKRKVRT